MEDRAGNIRIAKNTVVVYVRMAVTILVGAPMYSVTFCEFRLSLSAKVVTASAFESAETSVRTRERSWLSPSINTPVCSTVDAVAEST